MARKGITYNNTDEGWKELYKIFFEDGTIERNININMDISQNVVNSNTGNNIEVHIIKDLEMLSKLFPFAYALYIKKLIDNEKKLNVNIIIPESNLELYYKLGIFIWNVAERKYLNIVINERRPPSTNILEKVGRIVPLFEVENKQLIEKNNLNEAIQSYKELKNLFQKNSNYMKSGKFFAENFTNRLLEYIEDRERYKGTEEQKIDVKNKEKICIDMTKEVESWIGYMDTISYTIWLMILRELIDSKQIYIFNGSKVPELNEKIIIKSRMDAISYGEAIYQLIENACIHSEGKRAWFGFYMHRAGTGVALGENLAEAQNRDVLYRRYRRCIKEKTNQSIFDKNTRFYFEFFVIDSAFLGNGLLDKLEETRGIKLESIEQMFSIPISKDNYEDDIANHYGLRLLRRIVYINNGCILCNTPRKNERALIYYKQEDEESKNEKQYITSWNILLPILYEWNNSEDVIKNEKYEVSAFGKKISRPRKNRIYIDMNKLLADDVLSGDKKKDIYECCSQLKKYMKEEKESRLAESIVIIELGKSVYKLEIFVKSLFSQIVTINYKRQDKPLPLMIAVIMPHITRVHEFMRFYSILYDDNGKLDVMENVQIALCLKELKEDSTYGYHVECILAGKYLSTSMRAARFYAYHHPEYAIEHLPLVKYLTDTKNSHYVEEDLSLFPFELFIPNELTEYGFRENDKNIFWEDNWFVSRISKLLSEDIRKSSMGCYIGGVHVRIGSKLHLDSFYEAELLFHDSGNVQCFAYLMAQDILFLNPLNDKIGTILLLGYEKYSVSLMLQLERWIKMDGRFTDVCTAIIYDSTMEGDVILKPYFDTKRKRKNSQVGVISVAPIGTTLSTIYKMHNKARKSKHTKDIMENALEQPFVRDYCLVLVGDNNNGKGSVIKNYWNDINTYTHYVYLEPERKMESRATVRYLIKVGADLQSSEQCEFCNMKPGKVYPVIDVKNSEMLPGAIFPSYTKRIGTILRESEGGRNSKNKNEYEDDNRERMLLMFGNVVYTHVYDGNNHFQFYIDFKELYIRNSDKIDNYLKSISIDENAFHVVVSPLQIANAGFVKSVLDNVFHGCAHFLHFNIAEAYREEVRTKFSYITEDYKLLKHFNPKAKFYVHYIDNSITSGSLITRSADLMRMLINESKIDEEDTHIFEGIFLIVNRSSYDTLRTFVKNPLKNIYSYIKLVVPSYNTERDICPACRLLLKYNLLKKRSSTGKLSHEFSRLVQKHAKKSIFEFRDSMGNRILNSTSYFGWLREWLYINDINEDSTHFFNLIVAKKEKSRNAKEKRYENQEKIMKNVEGLETAQQLKIAIEAYLDYIMEIKKNDYIIKTKKNNRIEIKKNRQKILEILSKICIEDVLRYSERNDKAFKINREEVINLVKLHLIGTRDYMRLYSLETAYEALKRYEKEDLNFKTEDEENEDNKNIILNLINEKLFGKDEMKMITYEFYDNSQREKYAVIHNAEWMISYLKVLSRPHIINYYPSRRAIADVLYRLYSLMMLRNNDVDEIDEKKNFYEEKEEILKSNKLWGKMLWTIEMIMDLKSISDNDTMQIYALLRYQIYVMLVHRMSDLQMSRIINNDNINSYIDLYVGCSNSCFLSDNANDTIYYPIINFPDENAAVTRYLKSVKAATMLSNDDIPCFELINIKYKEDIDTESAIYTEKSRTEMQRLLVDSIYMENTRMLYSGMGDLENVLSDELKREEKNKRPAEQYSQSMKNLINMVDKEIDECYSKSDYSEENILYQNILGRFCEFWHRSMQNAPIPSKESGLSYMFRFYRYLQKISKMEYVNKDELPYLYEDLCRSINYITGYKMCYIVYARNGSTPEVITQSGYYAEYLRDGEIFSVEKIERTLTEYEKKIKSRREAVSAKKILLERENKDTKDMETLTIKLSSYEEIASDEFYIILQRESSCGDAKNNYDKLTKEDLKILRNVLFMRQTLMEVLIRDYTRLMNLRFDCSYIRKLNEGEYPRALHLSDLHIDSNIPYIIEELKKLLDKKLSEKYIDLLLISGDIVDSRKASAPVMEERYHYAEKVLNEIVIRLWSESDYELTTSVSSDCYKGYIPHDWKRRVVISTGNHDYASMNQYQSALSQRNLVPGLPIETESSTMSKFAYFIDFLIRYLDVPVDEILRNDLNEVRDYRNLNIKLLVLNCSSLATPRRTNKMGVNNKIVNNLIDRFRWTNLNEKNDYDTSFRMCLAHYSPGYDLSYFVDKFQQNIPGWEWDTDKANTPINKLVMDYFVNAIKKEFDDRYHIQKPKNNDEELRFRNEFLELEKALDSLKDGGTDYDGLYYKHLKSKCDKKPKDFVLKMRNNELYNNMKAYYEWLGNKDRRNEKISKLVRDVKECIVIGDEDKKIFAELINKIGESYKLDLYLAGHIHAYDEKGIPDKVTGKIKSKEDIPILIADKTFELDEIEIKNINGYLISEIGKEKKISGGYVEIEERIEQETEDFNVNQKEKDDEKLKTIRFEHRKL